MDSDCFIIHKRPLTVEERQKTNIIIAARLKIEQNVNKPLQDLRFQMID